VKIIKKSALPAAVQAKLTAKKTESKVAAMESRSSITVVPEITYAVDPCIACRIDTTFRNRGKLSIYANPFVGALAYGNPTHCVEPLQGEALPGDESASSIGDSALATTPTAVSVQAAIASCAGNSERGLLYFNKTQQIGADGAASQSFRVFESVVTAALPVIAPVETALEEGAITTSIVKLVVSDAAQRRNVTIVHRGSRDTGKSRYFREACRSVLDQLGSVLERAMQLYHDEKARNAEQEALAQAAAAARSGGAGGAPAPLTYEAFADGGPSEASPTGLNRSTKDQRSPSSTRQRPSPRRPLTANSAESRTRFTLLSGHEGCITPRPPNLSIVSGIEASPRSGRHDAANAHGVQFGVDAGTPSAAGRPSPKNFNRRSSVKLRQALSALLKEPRLRQQLRHNGYGEEWVAATFNGRTSSLALAPIPDMERVIPSFAFDLWLRVADVAAEGQRQPPEALTAFTGALTRAPGFSPITVKREPMTLVQICENDRPDVGMMMWVGLNFNADAHDDTLRVYVRDNANRVMEVQAVMTGHHLTDGHWHHVRFNLKSVEETVVECSIDGRQFDRLRYAQTEHPKTWTHFGSHHVFVGGFRDSSTGIVTHPFKGQIAELRLWMKDRATEDFVHGAFTAAMSEYHKVQNQLSLLPPASHSEADAFTPMMTTPTGLTVRVSTRFGKIRKQTQQQTQEPASMTPLLATDRPPTELIPVARYPLMQLPRDEEGSPSGYDSDGGLQNLRTFTDQIIVTGVSQRAIKRTASPTLRRAGSTMGTVGGTLARSAGSGVAAMVDAVVYNVETVASEAPRVAPVFDGCASCVNIGTLGDFGAFLQNFTIEMRFRSTVSDRMMVLCGVTDTQHKKAQLIIALNAEPTLTPERLRYHSMHTAFCLVDATGRVMGGILRGSERQNHLTDGNWHTLTWRVLDAESNKMEVKVDGALQDAVVSVRDGPRNFVPFNEWVAIGGHNVRGWRVRNLFAGSINRCTISIRGETYGEWMFDEGPGAMMAVDTSGHGFHAAYYDCVAGQRMKHGLLWAAQHDNEKEEEELLEAAAAASGGPPKPIIHLRNDVRFALLNFTARIDPATGKAVEAVYNMLAPPPKLGKKSVGNDEMKALRRKLSILRGNAKRSRASVAPDQTTRSLGTVVTEDDTDFSPNATMTLADTVMTKGGSDDEQSPSRGEEMEGTRTMAAAAATALSEADDSFEAAAKFAPPFGAELVHLEVAESMLTRIRRGIVAGQGWQWTQIPPSCFVEAESATQPKNVLTAALHFVAETEAFQDAHQRLHAERQRERDEQEQKLKAKAALGAGASRAADDANNNTISTINSATSRSKQRRAKILDQPPHRFTHMPRIGHLVLVVAIGDCHITFVDMKGPVLPPHSHYAAHATKWNTPIASYGTDKKLQSVMNNSFVAVDRVLEAATLCPAMVKHCARVQDPQSVRASLQKQSYPTELGGVLYSALLNVDFGSRVFTVFSLPVHHNEDEALSLAAPFRTLAAPTAHVAAITIQRVVRGLLGRRRFARVKAAKQQRSQRVHELAAMRESAKAVFLPKKDLVATVIAVLNVHAGKTSHSLAEHDTELTNQRAAMMKQLLTSQGVRVASSSSHPHEAAEATGGVGYVPDPVTADLFAPVHARLLQRVVSGLAAQGYTVRTLINPDATAILSALRTLDAAANNFVYIVGYGVTRFAYPRFPKVDLLACGLEEDVRRIAIEKEALAFFAPTRYQSLQQLEALKQALAAAASKGKKRGGSGRPAPRVAAAPPASPPTSARPPSAAAPSKGSPRKGAKGIVGKADSAAASEARAESTQASELRALELMENDVRTVSVQRDFEMSWTMLSTELRRALTALRDFETLMMTRFEASDKLAAAGRRAGDEAGSITAPENRAATAAVCGTFPALLPRNASADVRAGLPGVQDCMTVAELVSASMKHLSTPLGYQCTVAIELLAATSAVRPKAPFGRTTADAFTAPPRSAGLLATSAGHTLGFHFNPAHGTSHCLSWQLAKALHGHIAANIVGDQQVEGVLYGAVPSLPAEICRDAVSMLDYIGVKLTEPSHASKVSLCDPALQRAMPDPRQLLELPVPYNGDLVPLRQEPTTAATRAGQRKSLESKRAMGVVRLLADAEKSVSEVTNEVRHLLPDLQASEAVPTSSVLVMFETHTTPHLRTLANLDVGDVLAQIAKFYPRTGPIAFTAVVTADGLMLAGHIVGEASTASDKLKLAAPVPQIAQRAPLLQYRCLQKAAFDATKTAVALRQTMLEATGGTADPCDGTSNYVVREVLAVYTARGSTSLKKWRRMTRRLYEAPRLSPHLLLHSAVEDA
jgi:hypothetical protein